MALNIKNERVHDLAREAARRTGTTQVSALEAALEQYLAALAGEGATRPAEAKFAAASEIVGRMQGAMTDADREAIRADLDAMYDEHGLPA